MWVQVPVIETQFQNRTKSQHDYAFNFCVFPRILSLLSFISLNFSSTYEINGLQKVHHKGRLKLTLAYFCCRKITFAFCIQSLETKKRYLQNLDFSTSMLISFTPQLCKEKKIQCQNLSFYSISFVEPVLCVKCLQQSSHVGDLCTK